MKNIAEIKPLENVASPDIHIASMVIYARPDCRDHVIDFLNGKPACTLYREESKAALVVILEVEHERSINAFMDELHALPGLLSANLVYHHVDSESAMNQEMIS